MILKKIKDVLILAFMQKFKYKPHTKMLVLALFYSNASDGKTV